MPIARCTSVLGLACLLQAVRGHRFELQGSRLQRGLGR